MPSLVTSANKANEVDGDKPLVTAPLQTTNASGDTQHLIGEMSKTHDTPRTAAKIRNPPGCDIVEKTVAADKIPLPQLYDANSRR